MKLLATLLFLAFTLGVHCQEVNYNETIYKIKGKSILKDGTDITKTLTVEEQEGIWDTYDRQMALIKEREAYEKKIEKAEKEEKKAEKEQKRAEKAQKKAEKALKEQERAQSKYDIANVNYNKAVKRYDTLKEKGKLSPNDEEKWLKRIKNLKEDVDKAKRKL